MKLFFIKSSLELLGFDTKSFYQKLNPFFLNSKKDTSKEDEISNTRTSQTAWFSPDDYDWVDKINQRITDVTGLSADMQASHSELMQVANYG